MYRLFNKKNKSSKCLSSSSLANLYYPANLSTVPQYLRMTNHPWKRAWWGHMTWASIYL